MALCPLEYSQANYSCSRPYPNCTAPAGLQLDDLWKITQGIAAACPTDERLVSAITPALTQAACVALAGSGWTSYPSPDILSRLATFKLPLLQLVALFPRPPLGLKEHIFVLVRLLGNPIGTLKNLVLKIGSCQRYIAFWDRVLSSQSVSFDSLASSLSEKFHREDVVRDLTVISFSFDEWDFRASEEFQYRLASWLASDDTSLESKAHLFDLCRRTSQSLSADRSISSLPIAVALMVFIGTIAIAMVRAREAATVASSSMFEINDTAFTALYLWLLPITILSTIIGSPQTKGSTRRILQMFNASMRQDFWDFSLHSLSEATLTSRGGISKFLPTQVQLGSILSWRPETIASRVSSRWLRFGSFVYAFFVVLSSLSTAILIAYFIPPVGFGCDSGAELTIAALWIINGTLLDYIPINGSPAFWLAFVKDSMVAVMTVSGGLLPVIGVLNRCSCYTTSNAGVALPQIDTVEDALYDGFEKIYPTIAFTSVGLQLFIFPAVICWNYSRAIKAFLYRDNGSWVSHLWDRMPKLKFPSWKRDFDDLPIGRMILSKSTCDSTSAKFTSSSRYSRSSPSNMKRDERNTTPNKERKSSSLMYSKEKGHFPVPDVQSSQLERLRRPQVSISINSVSDRHSVAADRLVTGYSSISLGLISSTSTSKPSSVFVKEETRPESIAPSMYELDPIEHEFAQELAKRTVMQAWNSTFGQKSCAPSQADGRSSGFSAQFAGSDASEPPSKKSRTSRGENRGDGYSGDDPAELDTPRTTNEQPVNLFACPYTKFDPERYSERNQREKNYRSCAGKYLTDISRLKQHLYRVHKLPMWYCGTCFRVFDSRPALHAHGRERPPCNVQEPKFEEMMTDDQYEEIKPRERCTPPEAWYRIFKVLFPGAPLPISPYVSSCDPIAVRHFAQLFRAFGPHEMYRLLQSRPLQLETSTQEIIREAFETALSDYIALSQGHMQSAETLIGVEASMLTPQYPSTNSEFNGDWSRVMGPSTLSSGNEEPDFAQTAGYQAWYHETVEMDESFDMLKVVDSTGMESYETQRELQ